MIVHKVDVICCMVFNGTKLSKNSRFVTKDEWSKAAGHITGARAMLVCTVTNLQEFAECNRTPNEVAL